MSTVYTILADFVVAIHLAYILFVILGEIAILLGIVLRWSWVRNPWFRWIHLLAIVIVAVEAIVHFKCPCTTLENNLRRSAGEDVSGETFIGRLINDIMFLDVPEWILTSCYIGFALLVAATFWLAPPRRWGDVKNHLSASSVAPAG
jgi:hypothetical protein